MKTENYLFKVFSGFIIGSLIIFLLLNYESFEKYGYTTIIIIVLSAISLYLVIEILINREISAVYSKNINVISFITEILPTLGILGTIEGIISYSINDGSLTKDAIMSLTNTISTAIASTFSAIIINIILITFLKFYNPPKVNNNV